MCVQLLRGAVLSGWVHHLLPLLARVLLAGPGPRLHCLPSRAVRHHVLRHVLCLCGPR